MVSIRQVSTLKLCKDFCLPYIYETFAVEATVSAGPVQNPLSWVGNLQRWRWWWWWWWWWFLLAALLSVHSTLTVRNLEQGSQFCRCLRKIRFVLRVTWLLTARQIDRQTDSRCNKKQIEPMKMWTDLSTRSRCYCLHYATKKQKKKFCITANKVRTSNYSPIL